MGNAISNRISFEDMQYAQTHHLIISTLSSSEQDLLISHTINYEREIAAVENAIKHKQPIIVYGKHANDPTIYKKCEQIKKLGGVVYLYTGGLFEWLLLQDIYGPENFKTTQTSRTIDILKYKPSNVLNTKYLTY
jgi:hypothetical protein